MGGVGLQQFFICCFVGLAIRFQRQMKRDASATDHRRALRLLYILYAVLTLITVSDTIYPPRTFSNKRPAHMNRRSASSSAWPNTPTATRAASPSTKHTSTSSTPPSCSSLSCSSISCIRAKSCRVRRAISRAGSRGRRRGKGM